MALNEKRIMDKIMVAQNAALLAAADVAIFHARNLTPIWRGNLRRDLNKSQIDANTVHVIQSPPGSDSHEYAAIQYGATVPPKSLRHAGVPEKFEPLTKFDPGLKNLEKVKKKKLARGDLNKYRRSYNYAVENNLIKKHAPPKWLSRVIKDEKVLRKMFAVYRRFWTLKT